MAVLSQFQLTQPALWWSGDKLLFNLREHGATTCNSLLSVCSKSWVTKILDGSEECGFLGYLSLFQILYKSSISYNALDSEIYLHVNLKSHVP